MSHLLQTIVDAIVAFVHAHPNMTLVVIFLVAFGESFCFFSLFWPGWAILLGIGGVVAASGAGFWLLMLAIVAGGAGGALGYAASYWIGYHFKDRIDGIWPFSTRPYLIPEGQRFFQKYGALGVFFGHFVGPIRAVIPVVAGMFAMPQLPFQVANIVSAFIWAAFVIISSFMAVAFKDVLFDFLLTHESLIALLLFVLAFALAVPNTFLFVPAAFLFIGLGFLHLLAGGDFGLILFASAAGAFTGDMLGYSFGADGIEAPWLEVDMEEVGRTRLAVEREGLLSVVTSKFRGLRRTEVPYVAGALNLPRVQFAVVSGASAVLWAAVFLCPAIIVSLFVT